MSGLYTALHGENKFADEIMDMIYVPKDILLRYRDVYVFGNEAIVYTRNGGNNRMSVGIKVIMESMKSHPNYVRDYDDSFDNTYAYIVYKIPEQFRARAKEIEEQQGEVLTVAEKFKRLEEPGVMEKMMAEKHPGMMEVVNMLTIATGSEMPQVRYQSDNFNMVGFKPKKEDENGN
jgi:hypothetical protein